METPSQSILARLAQRYDEFTKTEKKIADYVLSHEQEAQYMTITELAGECQVADATLTRFCRRLGCDGFNDFKLSLAKATASSLPSDSVYGLYGEQLPTDSVDTICRKLYHENQEALSRTFQLVDPEGIRIAADYLCRANRVYCFGQGASSIMAMEAWGRFITVTAKFQWVQDSHMQAIAASLLCPEDAVLYFSFSGSTRDLIEVAQLVRERGGRLILVTGFPRSPSTGYANVQLLCGAVEGPLQAGSVAARISQLYIIDVLFHEFCRRDMEQTLKNTDLTTNSIASKHL